MGNNEITPLCDNTANNIGLVNTKDSIDRSQEIRSTC